MLIIFDLDDTLIDTSGEVLPFKLRAILKALSEQGLHDLDQEKALQILLDIDQTSESSKQTIEKFLASFENKEKYLEIALQTLKQDLPKDFILNSLDHAKDLLIDLKKQGHLLALVTVGNSILQKTKMKKAGIEESFFSKLIVANEPNKKPHYQAIKEELIRDANEVLVCGDRISLDLTPAKQLGFHTVHMKWGRGKKGFGCKSDVDFSINHLSELKEIIARIVKHG